MLENIALIKEVHFRMPTKKAQALATEYLQKINLSHIGDYRVNQCSSLEVFYVMFIRALMTKEKNIIVKTPYAIIESLRDIKSVFNNIEKLNDEKKIFILDTQNNQTHYEGCLCNIVK